MFDELRDTLRTFSGRLAPDERRRVTTSMRDAMVHAKLAIRDLRDAASTTHARLLAERTDLETVRRRQGLAAQIGDTETVAIAEKFAAQHAGRVGMLESKLMAQQQELTVVEREYEDMSSQLRMAMAGVAPGAATSPDVAAAREVDALLSDVPPSTDESMAPPARRSRAEKEASAESRLADLKRRMGK